MDFGTRNLVCLVFGASGVLHGRGPLRYILELYGEEYGTIISVIPKGPRTQIEGMYPKP